MTEPDLADRLLNILVDSKSSTPTGLLATVVEREQVDIVKCIYAIKERKPGYLRIAKGYGSSELSIIIPNNQKDSVQAFLDSWGFVGEFDQMQKLKEKDEKIKDLQIENLPVLTKQANRAIEDSSWAVRLSALSLLVSILALLTPLLLDRCN